MFIEAQFAQDQKQILLVSLIDFIQQIPPLMVLRKLIYKKKRQLHNLFNIEPKKISLLHEKTSFLNHLLYHKTSIKNIEVKDFTEYMSVKILIERFKQPEISENNLFKLVQNCDFKVMNQFFQKKFLIVIQLKHINQVEKNYFRKGSVQIIY
ncbi:unnamed protein product [Paramecium sonneborni]|uniref:Uncharacterized protein n=1 Tax=Paramecium sonneborni TaxID=65129 RepID=A0A8S1PDU1_9CILI|nr:unnamed protein product [Paramecium sonneborni]CAD8100722.1 unnamed protein product [Paramecium sonneborni]